MEQAELDDAFDAMNDISNYINEVKRDHEALDVIETIQRSVRSDTGELLHRKFSDYGRLLQDGVVELKEGNGKSKPRYVFVFEICLMVCKQKVR